MTKTCNILVNDNSLNPPIHALFYDDFFNRLKGLMFRSELSQEDGIILVQRSDSRMDSSIHMLGVFMDLGIIWINSQMTVVDMVLAKSWKPIYIPANPAKYTLEVNPARMNDFHIKDKVQFNEIS